jgi:hypothetical protein
MGLYAACSSLGTGPESGDGVPADWSGGSKIKTMLITMNFLRVKSARHRDIVYALPVVAQPTGWG